MEEVNGINVNKKDGAACKCSFTVSEGSDEGTIVWKFDFTDSGAVVDSVRMQCSTWLHDTGRVLLKLCSGEMCTLVPGGMIIIYFALYSVVLLMSQFFGNKTHHQNKYLPLSPFQNQPKFLLLISL
jgi:hypothetical protein